MSISGKSKTEATYRAVNLDSSSSLKEFSMDRKKYYRKYIQGENIEDADNKAATIGRVVETLLLEPEEFDGRFFMSSCVKAPTGMMLDFVEALYKHTKEATDDSGSVTRPFDEICKDAHVDSGFKIKLDAVLAKFVGTDNEVYYKEIREVRSKGLTVVTTQDVTNAEYIVEELKQNFATKDVVNLVNSARYTIHNQFQVEGYSVDGHLFKSMMDKVVIDHENKTIQVYDLKCVWSVEGFYEDYYLYRRAYIQAYLYHKAAIHIAEMNEDLRDYSVLYPKFIVCDSINYMNPLVYTLDNSDYLKALEGFEHKGKFYPGVKELIKDLDWAIVNDRWNISRKNFENGGKINIRG
jgi:hypothetical protein